MRLAECRKILCRLAPRIFASENPACGFDATRECKRDRYVNVPNKLRCRYNRHEVLKIEVKQKNRSYWREVVGALGLVKLTVIRF